MIDVKKLADELDRRAGMAPIVNVGSPAARLAAAAIRLAEAVERYPEDPLDELIAYQKIRDEA